VTERVQAGVFGVGHMGAHHARIYAELPGVDLVGVHDADEERAAEVAAEYGTQVLDEEAVIDRADAVSVTVPTRHHYDVARKTIDAGASVLVEKPFVETAEQGRDLTERAAREDVTLQVGHIERFNPAVRALGDVLADLEVIAVDARRLGPPVDRAGQVEVTRDLMIHDIDVLLSMLEADGDDIVAVEAADAEEGRYVSAVVRFEDGTVATLQASRVTQQKVRTLSVTAADARVNVDYIDQSVHIHRHSLPEYIEEDGEVQYRQESIVEQPMVGNGEPLKEELSAFVQAVRSGEEPPVTGEDGLRALELAWRVEEAARADQAPEAVPR